MTNLVQVKELFDDTWCITEGEGRGATHCYLLIGSNSAILIDTGLGTINLKEVIEQITNKPICVINTHGHIDHISQNYQFDKVYLNEADEEIFLEHSSTDFRKKFFKQRLIKKGASSEVLEKADGKAMLTQLCTLPKNQNRFNVNDKQKIDLGNRQIEIITTPGHTIGSLCVYDKNNQALFTGDTLCEEGVLLYFDHSTSVKEYKNSLLKIVANTEIKCLYPGHQTTPLSPYYIQAYIACCDSILYEDNDGKFVTNQLGEGWQSKKENATITYSRKGELYE